MLNTKGTENTMLNDTQDAKQLIGQYLSAIREQKPLVVNITNYVVMNNSANALLAIGASPIMAHSQQEMAEMMSFAGALVINIGTLDSVWVPRMQFAVEQANKNNTLVVLDPVGCGASLLRTQTARAIATNAKKLIVRGNASEIIALAGEQAQSKGVDSLDSSDQAVEAAKLLAQQYQCSVVISGKTDYIITENRLISMNNGHSMMPFVTGMGCTHTAITGAAAAIGDHTGLTATAILGVAGEMAAELSNGPGSLQVNLIDTLYQLDEQALLNRLNITVEKR